jgi:hypothetical protein
MYGMTKGSYRKGDFYGNSTDLSQAKGVEIFNQVMLAKVYMVFFFLSWWMTMSSTRVSVLNELRPVYTVGYPMKHPMEYP